MMHDGGTATRQVEDEADGLTTGGQAVQQGQQRQQPAALPGGEVDEAVRGDAEAGMAVGASGGAEDPPRRAAMHWLAQHGDGHLPAI
jgi:hypothetical protein